MNNKDKGFFLVFLTALISGISIVINKFAVSFSSPYIFTFFKNILVSFFFTLLIFRFNDVSIIKKLGKKEWFLLIAIGFLGGSIPFLLFFKGLSLIPSYQAGFWHKTLFLYAFLLAFVFLKEKPKKEFYLAALLLFGANLFWLKKTSFSFGLGDALVIFATIFWAGENVISRYLLKNTALSGRVIAWARMFFGSLFILIFLVFSGQIGFVFQLNPSQMGWVLITACFLLAYVLTWYSGLKYVPVSLATAVLMFGNIITFVLNFISGTKPTPFQVLGLLMVVLATTLIIGFKRIIKVFSTIRGYVRT